MYDSEGNFIKSLYFPTTPELVLVEPSVVARAPVEYLTSGILDALSKWYELKPIFSRMENPDIHTRSSIELSRLLKDTIEQEGPAAVAAAKNGETNEELIHIIDINIYITGVIKCLSIYTLTIAVAHAINNSLSYIKESHSSLHGMKVGYGIVVQQCLEGESDTNVKSIIDLFKQLGFTPSLESMGVPASQEYKERVADNCIDDEGVKNMPFTITREMMLKSIERVEDIAR
jgi:glycerol dehydrogenase